MISKISISYLTKFSVNLEEIQLSPEYGAMLEYIKDDYFDHKDLRKDHLFSIVLHTLSTKNDNKTCLRV